MEGPAAVLVDAPEDEGLLTQFELLKAGEAGAHDHIAVVAVVVSASPALPEGVLQPIEGAGAHGVQAFVGVIDVRLLGREVGMGHKRESSSMVAGASPRKYAATRTQR